MKNPARTLHPATILPTRPHHSFHIVAVFVILLLSLTFNRCYAQNPVPLGLCLENYSYPYPVQYITLHVQQQTLKMAYMDVHPSQPNGQTILLLHGKNFCGAYWGPTARALAAKGFRVIIPDQVGFGKSSKPDHLQYTFQLLAQNTLAILDSAHIDKVFVLGHSMGGMLAARFTLMYPHRVERLILEDPIGLEDWRIKVPYQNIDSWYHNELRQTYASLKKYEMDSYFHGTWRPEYDSMLNIPAGWLLSPDYDRMAYNSALTYDMIFTQPVCYEFGQISVPTLLLIGELDRTALGKNLVPDSIRASMGNYPVLGRQTREKIPHCQLIIFPGIGHVPHMEAFTTFIQPVLNFLQPWLISRQTLHLAHPAAAYFSGTFRHLELFSAPARPSHPSSINKKVNTSSATAILYRPFMSGHAYCPS